MTTILFQDYMEVILDYKDEFRDYTDIREYTDLNSNNELMAQRLRLG